MNIRTQPWCRNCDGYFSVPKHRMATAKYCSRRCRKINTPEILKEKKRAWRYKNMDKVRIQSRIRTKRWKERNPERAKQLRSEIGKRAWLKHHDKRIANQRTRYWANPEKYRKIASDWARANPEKIRAYRRKKYATDPRYRLQVNAYTREREARKRNQRVGNLKPFLQRLASHKNLRCHWCGKMFPLSKLTLDHVNPLKHGGAHAAFNIVPACSPCNCRKQSTPPNKFIKSGQLLLVY